MNDLNSKLESMINSLQEMSDILSKSGNKEDISMNILYKEIEDGILDRIHTASEYQLNHIMNTYYFKYYNDFNTDKDLLKRVINQKLRNKKIESLIN